MPSTVGWVEVRNPTKKQSSPDEVKHNPGPLFSPYPSPFSFGAIRCAIAPYGACCLRRVVNAGNHHRGLPEDTSINARGGLLPP
ncbi:MAG: hypothetical protein GY820_23680 [Gammaproteobacteria bacterium]|nr:hypothetical protein [Gammaproteobacteria bacterium]